MIVDLHTNGVYVVRVCEGIRDPLLNTELTAYGVINTETGVREAETRRLHNAITTCDQIAAAARGDAPAQGEFDLPVYTMMN